MIKAYIKPAMAAAMVLLFATATLLTPAPANLWALLTQRGFFVPKESSVFQFRTTQDNPGSGEWWLYGEDAKNYFALHPTSPIYLVQSRTEAVHCAHFRPKAQTTWCSARQAPTPTNLTH